MERIRITGGCWRHTRGRHTSVDSEVAQRWQRAPAGRRQVALMVLSVGTSGMFAFPAQPFPALRPTYVLAQNEYLSWHLRRAIQMVLLVCLCAFVSVPEWSVSVPEWFVSVPEWFVSIPEWFVPVPEWSVSIPEWSVSVPEWFVSCRSRRKTAGRRPSLLHSCLTSIPPSSSASSSL